MVAGQQVDEVDGQVGHIDGPTNARSARRRPPRRPRPVAANGPIPGRRHAAPRRRRRRTSGSGWPGAATTKTGAQRGLSTAVMVCSSIVVPGCRGCGIVALSWPIRREAPPTSTTAASAAGALTARRRSRCPGRAATPATPTGREVRPREPRRPARGGVVIGGPVDLSENPHHGCSRFWSLSRDNANA